MASLEVLLDLVLSFAASPWVYALVVLLVVIDGVFPIVPSEAAVVGLAALSATSDAPDPLLLALVATCGAMAGDAAAFFIGRWCSQTGAGQTMRIPLLGRLGDWAKAGLEHRPGVFMLTARFIPMARVAVNVTAGTGGYAYFRLAPFCLIASAAWAIYNVALGYLAGQWFSSNPLLGMGVAIVTGVLLGLILDSALTLWRATTTADRRPGS